MTDSSNGKIAASAFVDPSASLGDGVTIGHGAVVSAGAKLGDGVTIEAGAIIYENVTIGEGGYIGAQCILGERQAAFHRPGAYDNPPLVTGAGSTIRSGTIIYSGCSFGRNFQTGNRAVIREESHFGDDCSFGTLSQSDGHIKVGDRCRFHNNVFIATYTTCEDDVHFYPMSCTTDSLHPPCQKGRQGPYLESGAIVGARVLLLPRVRIGKGAVVAGGSVVAHDIEAGMVAIGSPAKAVRRKDEVRCHIEDRPAWDVAAESLTKA